MNKHAQEDYIKEGILALIVLLIVLPIFFQATNLSGTTAKAERCSSHVKIASIAKNPITRESRMELANACPTEQVVVRPKGKTEDEIRNNALDEILYHQYICGSEYGYSYGEVNWNPFTQWKVDNICVICSNISFDPGFGGKQLEGLFTRSTESFVQGQRTYYEFFNGIKPSDEIQDRLAAEKEFIIDTKENYYIVYLATFERSEIGFWKWVGAGGGALGAGLAGKTVLAPLMWVGRLAVGGKMKIVKIALIGTGILAGATAGDYLDENIGYLDSVAIMLIPAESDSLTEVCKNLGKNPDKDPWEEEI